MESHSLFSFFLDYQRFLLSINPQHTAITVLALLGLLMIAFTISGAEVALFSLTNKDIDMLKTKQHIAAKRIVKLLDEPKEVYASLLIGGTIVNISIIILSNFLIENNLPFGTLKAGSINSSFLYIIELLMRAMLIAFLLIFIGRMLPKVWATQNNLRFAYGTALTVEWLHILLRKVSVWAVSLADNIGKQTGADKSQEMNIRELDEAIETSNDADTSPEEKNIMKGILKFGDIQVKQIMRSRLDVSGINHSMSFNELLPLVEELHYSRLPVFKDTIDTVVGIINTKDIIPHLKKDHTFDWHQLIRPSYFVPETKPIEDLLKEFQLKRIHFAVVVDEFGGTSGIVTMEDILEEVIGDIRDEFDEEENSNKKIDDRNFLFDGKTMIHDACKQMKLPVDTFDAVKGESDSLAGLVLELARHFPAINDVITCGDFHFTILQTEQNRIQQMQVTINPPM
ncbi:MAG: gliding motility-associated protein GldE [Bacteroidota bacterium]